MPAPPSFTVADLMTRKPVRVRPDERLDIAQALMVSCRFRHLPVEAEGALVGVVSLRDLYAADLPTTTSTRAERALHLRGLEVRQVMSAPAVTAAPGDSWWSAARALLAHDLSCLPVVDGAQLVGILTRTDFLPGLIELLDGEGRSVGRRAYVATLMTPQPLTLTPIDHLDLARSLMAAHRVRHLPVLDRERLAGMVSDHDLLRAEVSNLTAARPVERLEQRASTLVREVMTKRVATVAGDDEAVEAARLLMRRRFGALPVVTARKLVGILSVTDLFYHLLSYAPANHPKASLATRAGGC